MGFEYGIDTIPEGLEITVNARDLMYVHQVLAQLVSYFHQPLHWPTHAAVAEFMGTRAEGALGCVWEAYYQRLRDLWPAEIEAGFDEGRYTSPISPFFAVREDGVGPSE